MGNKMLIDAAHPEETRVVVLRGNRIEEFDFESASKKQLRGNIYLAKVTRVEPSLQAAFVEYGGNRHGFLAFSEIHPDYYQIPVADRQQLLEEEARSAEEDEEDHRGGNGNGGHRRSRRHRRGGHGSAEKRAAQNDETVRSEEGTPTEEIESGAEGADETPAFDGRPREDQGFSAAAQFDVLPADGPVPEADPAEAAAQAEVVDAISSAEPAGSSPAEALEAPAAQPTSDLEAVLDVSSEAPQPAIEPAPDAERDAEGDDHDGEAHDGEAHDEEAHEEEAHEEEVVEQLGGDALEDVPHRISRPRRNYKIQEVIKRRQVLLVQVVKEERGNKGAALTTYLSLAGRYSVLMPNTARGGGISRKIVDPEDRKRLKAIAQELDVPEGMGIILRTAGAARGMPEVKRDFEYLLRMWETVRETTLKSTAPMLVYEEGSLIKRSIRDLFTKDVDEVVVSGDEAYREAKDFMRLLMPNQVRNVVPWRDPQPIFAKAGAEAQLDAMFSNQVVLKSGGYLVINQTEALVAIDVNSGRSTREHNIEDTALRTNLEAADEVARQLRLRDLAGLIVVDFIDMEEGRNDRAVERRLKEALKNDRARIQIGRISHFGLLEMSRQRMRTGVLEGSTVMCPHCAGSGTVRSVSSQALHVLRLLEDSLIRSAAYNLIARTRAEVAIYILNQKRGNLLDLEARFGVAITILADPGMTGMVYHAVERGTEATPPAFLPYRPGAADVSPEDELDEELEDETVEDSEETAGEGGEARADGEQARQGESEGEGGGRRRRRRRRRRGGREGQGAEERGTPQSAGEAGEDADLSEEDAEGEADAEHEAVSDMEAGFLPEPPVAETQAAEEESAPNVGDLPAVITRPVDLPAATEAEGTPAEAPVAEAAPSEEPAEAPRRRRTTRRTRTAAEPAGESETEEAAAPVRRSRRSRSRTADLSLDLEGAAPSADRDVGADTAKVTTPLPADSSASEPELPLAAESATSAASPSESVAAEPAEATSVSEAVPPAVNEPEQSEPAPAASADPDRPKRSGWWQRAKATFTAGS